MGMFELILRKRLNDINSILRNDDKQKLEREYFLRLKSQQSEIKWILKMYKLYGKSK